MADEHDHDHDHDEEELEEGGEEEEDDIVLLADAEGNETAYQFLAIVEVDGESYALLTPDSEDEDDENATEIFIFHYEQDEDGGEIFSDVADEATFEKVRAQAEALFSAEGDEEDDA